MNRPKLYFLVGPSGAGKDSLLGHLKRTKLSAEQPLVAHRYITRPPRPDDENHIELSKEDFQLRKSSGLFVFDWRSHDHCYGIGIEVLEWLKKGQSVIVNGSRSYMEKARYQYPEIVPIWVKVPNEVLRHRLVLRGRENSAQISERLIRNERLDASIPKDCITINNDKSINETLEQLLLMIEIIQNQQLAAITA